MKLIKEVFLPRVCSSRRKKMACILPSQNKWGSAAFDGLTSFLNATVGAIQSSIYNLEVTLFEVGSERDALKRVLAHLNEYHFDGVITVGAWCSTETAQLLKSEASKLAQFFCGVNNPKAMDLGGIPGVSGRGASQLEGGNHEARTSELLAVCPNINKAVFAYVSNPGNGNDEESFSAMARADIEPDRLALKAAFEKVGIEVIEVPLDLEKPISEQLVPAEVICVFREATRLSYLDDLITVAKVTQTPLYAADLGSVWQGAAFGYGDSGYEYGWETGKLLHRFLTEQDEYAKLPAITFDSPGMFKVNPVALKEQGVPLSEELLARLTPSMI